MVYMVILSQKTSFASMTKIINTEFWSLVTSALPGFIAENRGQMPTQLGLVQHIVLQNMIR